MEFPCNGKAAAKIAQAYNANSHRAESVKYKVGDLVMLSTINRQKEYKNSTESRVAKFMPRYDSPYEVIDINCWNLELGVMISDPS